MFSKIDEVGCSFWFLAVMYAGLLRNSAECTYLVSSLGSINESPGLYSILQMGAVD